jgi:D-alanyl-D-alanine carboxypeptidase/D-alanyl-D-alanine-endopeptidase (penicillin-binding protein 4)
MVSPAYRTIVNKLIAKDMGFSGASILAALACLTICAPGALAHIRHRTHKEPQALQHTTAKPGVVRTTGTSQRALKSLQPLVDAWLNRPELTHSLAGVDVIDVDTGVELASGNGRKRFNPASTEKIIVTACAYEKLGAKFVYKTLLATKGEVNRGTIRGDLLLIASQDPTLDRDDLRRLFATLRDKGITKVDGKFLVVEPPGGGERFLGEWLHEDWAQEWMPVSSSLVIDRNISSPSVFSKSKIRINHAQDVDSASHRTLLQSELTLGWLSYDPKDRTTDVYELNDSKAPAASRAVANPDTYNQALAEDIAKQVGIKFENHDFKPSANAEVTTLAEHDSAPLAQIIRTTLHESDNLYAQQLLRTLAAHTESKSQAANLEDRGLLIERAWLSSIGVPLDEVILWDGCGLSRKDYVTPHALCLVIRHMSTTEGLSPYKDLLTQASIKPGGTMQFKTGAMDSVRGMTGLLQTGEGKRLAFAILVNGHATSVRDVRTSISILVNGLDQARVESQPLENKSETVKAAPLPAGTSVDSPVPAGHP